jgi:hypothetical protein
MATSGSIATASVDLHATVEQLELSLDAASAELKRLNRVSLRWRLMDRAMTAALVTALSATLLAAASPVPSVVKAPFTVVDSAGKPMFIVNASPRGIQLLAEHSDMTGALPSGAFISTSPTGTSIKAVSQNGHTQSVLGVENENTPEVVLRDSGGLQRLILAVRKDDPELNLTNDSNLYVVSLDQGAFGGGRLQILNATGDARVLAGMVLKGIGVVRVMPDGNPGRGLFGLPGTFLCGVGCAR